MSLAVLDWRRRIADLYRMVRASQQPVEAHELWCDSRDELFKHHPASPVAVQDRSSFPGASYGAYDESFRFEVEIDTDVEPRRFEVETGTDGVVPFTRLGRVELGGLGQLDVWWLESYGGGIFVPFADESSQSYPGGRYVLDTTKGADLGGAIDLESGRGVLVIDLNFAYNPSCAYDPAWACPLAPEGNRLSKAVAVGEHYQSLEGPSGAI